LLTIHPPLADFPGADLSADAIRINRLIEDNIRLAPEQYFWVHRRFKARGAGYPAVY
jgi:KDO2-lipid IV(A) lauroyltransferase